MAEDITVFEVVFSVNQLNFTYIEKSLKINKETVNKVNQDHTSRMPSCYLL